jgi:hypothetical protein
MSAADVIYVRTKAGRIHKAALVNDRPFTDEACNLDEAPGAEEVLTQIPEDVEFHRLCQRCFPVPVNEDVGE